MCGTETIAIFLAAAALVAKYHVDGLSTGTYYIRHITNVLDDKSCSTTAFTQDTRSLMHCTTLCELRATCKSVFYKHDTSACTGCTEIYNDDDVTSLTDDVGTLYYRPYAFYEKECSERQPCIEERNTCFPGLETCVCDPWTSNYNEATDTCTPGCSIYSDGYQIYPGYSFVGFDQETVPLQYNVTACLEHCTAATGYTCHSMDWDHVGYICYYNNIHASDLPVSTELKEWSIFDTYMRHCLN